MAYISFRYWRLTFLTLVLTMTFFVMTALAHLNAYGGGKYEMEIYIVQDLLHTERNAVLSDIRDWNNSDLQPLKRTSFSAVQYFTDQVSLMLHGLFLVARSILEKQVEPVSQQAKGNKMDVLAQDGSFSLLASGIVYDSRTALEWYPGPDRNTTWYEAKAWVANLSVSGGQWRMPTIQELEVLHIKGHGDRNMSTLFTMSGWWVWAGDVVGSTASCYYFIDGERHSDFCFYSGQFRGFAVRKRKHQ